MNTATRVTLIQCFFWFNENFLGFIKTYPVSSTFLFTSYRFFWSSGMFPFFALEKFWLKCLILSDFFVKLVPVKELSLANALCQKIKKDICIWLVEEKRCISTNFIRYWKTHWGPILSDCLIKIVLICPTF